MNDHLVLSWARWLAEFYFHSLCEFMMTIISNISASSRHSLKLIWFPFYLTVPFSTHPQPVVDRRQLLRFFYTSSRRPRRQSISKWPAGAAGRLYWLPTIIIIKTRQDKTSQATTAHNSPSHLSHTHMSIHYIRLWVIAYNKCFICNFRFLQEMSSQLTACRVNENNKVLFCFFIL